MELSKGPEVPKSISLAKILILILILLFALFLC